jgi:hypothetical protein
MAKSGSTESGGTHKGGRPSLGPRKAFLLRLPPDLLAQLKGSAARELRSLNAHVEFLLRESMRREGRRKSKDDES